MLNHKMFWLNNPMPPKHFLKTDDDHQEGGGIILESCTVHEKEII